MSAASPNPYWQAHRDRLQRSAGAPDHSETPATDRTPAGALDAAEARRAEWTAAPPGRLGRRLLADVEPYLEFFAVAHDD